MSQKSLCIIFEATGRFNAIGKIAMAEAQAALAAGWRVSIVAKRLDESLQGRVEWLRLYAPPRGFALQWLTARHFIRQALGDRSRFDVVHGHQPQIADLCDVFECHFLTRAAFERRCLLDSHGWRRPLEWAQKRAVLVAEDRHFHHWNPATHMLFSSALTRDWFAGYYGMPPSQELLVCPSPRWNPVSPQERLAARAALGLPQNGIVAGFLGGLHERKGYRRVIAALAGQADITLLMGGAFSEGFAAPELEGRLRAIGLTDNTAMFYAACDVLLVASYFEPFGCVASEAASRGVPTISTDQVGALPHLLEHRAGARWDGRESLGQIIRQIHAAADDFRLGCQRYTQALSPEVHNRRLLALYDQIAASRAPARQGVSESLAVGSAS